MKRTSQQGFTLLEILLVVAAIAILAGIVILAINPTKQLGDTRNAQRKSDVNTILNAVYQHAVDNNGTLSTAILAENTTCANTVGAEICKTGGVCTGLTDLSVLTTTQKYLVSMPTDPTGSGTNNTGYRITKSANGRITLCATSAEQSATVSVTR
ncbi:MAG: type II secretion system protein [bacterium]|nr:type II secretion system protein [bacterium]